MESIASDLKHFRDWTLEEGIDYLHFPKPIVLRPTYLYCSYLHDLVSVGRISRNTAKRIIIHIQGFYKWIMRSQKLENPPWIEKQTSLNFTSRKGLPLSRESITTDLSTSFKRAKPINDYSHHINDGGRLKPLSQHEQLSIFKALIEISNTEMTLAFLLSITTGARLQSIFTLREKSILNLDEQGNPYLKLKIGLGTLVDTKYSKEQYLFIPSWLVQKMKVYIYSERRKNRVKKSINQNSVSGEQYIFLTKNGNPYYMSSKDPNAESYRVPPRGNGVTLFIKQQLKPQLNRMNENFDFKFHDLRASFGLNLVKTLFNSKNGIIKVLMYVKERMGHNHFSTTEQYLNYEENKEKISILQSSFEKDLLKIIESENDF